MCANVSASAEKAGADLGVFAQDGTSPHFAIRRRLSRMPSSRRSATIGTLWVGATFQLGPGGLPSTSTYLPHMR
jgi:hypothetical protein